LGQGAIEFVVCINAMILIFVATMTIFYLVYSKSLISYQLQKTILCTQKYNTRRSQCLKKTESFFEKNLWFHKNQKVNFSENNRFVDVYFKYSFLKKDSKITKKINILQ
jgi:hypothetical protein